MDVLVKEQEEWDYSDAGLASLSANATKRDGHYLVYYFEGSYSEYEQNKLARLGQEEPKRVKYRKLMAE